MGMLLEPALFVEQLQLPRGFSVCELGDQWATYLDPHQLSAQWFQALGCKRYCAIDGNGRGTLTADLNLPLPKLKPFDLVTDFGTGEHIFNQFQVWRSIHELTKPGGYIAFDRPTKGYPTHCYYLVDECLFHDLAAANAYEIVRLEHGVTKRGELIRGVFRRGPARASFRIPQQGRYQKALVINK
jgi:hypothetical protein